MTDKMYSEKEFIDAFRMAIEDRAKWFYLLLKYAREQGADVDEIARKAITEFGRLKGSKFGKAETALDFANAILTGPPRGAFAMEPVKLDENESVIRFRYCALVEAWRRMGCSPEEVAKLCELARYGDYGMVECFPNLTLEFKHLLSEGDDCCEMVISRK